MSTDAFSTATERDALCSFLDQARDALIRKVNGLSDEDARAIPTVSSLSLLGLLQHSAIWERRWFQVIFAGRDRPDGWPLVRDAPDGTFALGDEDTIESVLADYREQITASREITARRPRRPVRSIGPGRREPPVGGDAPHPGNGPARRPRRHDP